MPEATGLEQRLKQVALDLLREHGPEELSLRRIAREAGVSHGAPLRHFRGLGELLSEVAALGFQELREAVEKSGAQLTPGAGALARLRAGGYAYVECAVANPGLFALMFRHDALESDNENLRRNGAAAFEVLVRQVRAAQDAGWYTGRDTRLLAGSVWASVHGLAQLWSQGAIAPVVPGATLERALEQSLELLIGETPGGRS